MTEHEWLNSRNPARMIEFLRSASDRKCRLFACASFRSNHHGRRMIRIIEMAENFADGKSDKLPSPSRHSDSCLGWELGWYAASSAVSQSMASLPWGSKSSFTIRSSLTNRLHCLFGNPFNTVRLDQDLLTWRDATIPKLAQAAYDERELPSRHLDTKRLAILADALEESGCTNEDVLAHLRGAGPHVRGCWVVDLLLGRE